MEAWHGKTNGNASALTYNTELHDNVLLKQPATVKLLLHSQMEGTTHSILFMTILCTPTLEVLTGQADITLQC